MKTLLICGVFHTETMDLPVLYNITLFGQTKEKPEIQYITYLKLSLQNGYPDLVKKCKEEFCKYYEVDDNNIITLDSLQNTQDFSKLIIEQEEADLKKTKRHRHEK